MPPPYYNYDGAELSTAQAHLVCHNFSCLIIYKTWFFAQIFGSNISLGNWTKGLPFTKNPNNLPPLLQSITSSYQISVFFCDQCQYKVASESLLNIHSLHQHEEYKCNICGIQTLSKGNLAQHKRALHERVKYPCSQCGNQFTSKGTLDEHIRAVHEGVKYPCSQCGNQMTTRGALNKHIRAVHEGVKYPCSQCGNQLTTKGALDEHIRAVHEGVKYPCSQCGNQLTTKGALDEQIRAVHEGVKYPCSPD